MGYSDFDWEVFNNDSNIIDLLVETGLCKSRAEAKRLIYQDGVKVNGEVHSGHNIFDPINLDNPLILECRNKVIRCVRA